MAIHCHLKILMERKARREKRRISYRVIWRETGVSPNTLHKLAAQKASMYGRSTLEALCQFFECEIKELLEYVPDGAE